MVSPNLNIPDNKIRIFCCRWRVSEFALFGSVLRDDFRTDSDVDVLISFDETAHWSLWDLADMQQELEQIFGRPVDLVESGAVRNPFRRKAILASKEVLFASG